MPRILRNYLISFLIIGLFVLVVYALNQWADSKMAQQDGQPDKTTEEPTPANE